MYRSPVVAARHLLTIVVVSAVSLISMVSPAHAASLQHGASAQTIYRCDMRDGAVVFADSRCEGAAKVRKWAPEKLPMGIQRTVQRPEIESPAAASNTALVLGRQDPYVDCKERGGKFRVASRLCILPRKNPPTIIQRMR